MLSLKEKSFKGLFWEFAGRIGLQSVGFVVSIVLARLLAPAEFGLLAIINVFILLSSVFVDYGFNIALIQRKEVTEMHYSAVFVLNIAMGLVLSGIIFLLAPLISRFYENDLLVSITRFMSMGILISSFGHVMRTRLLRDLNFKVISIGNIIAACLSGSVAIVLAIKGFGVWSLAIQSVLNQLVINFYLYLVTKVRFQFSFRKYALIELWPFSARIFLSGLIDTVFTNLDTLIIGKLLNPTMLGYYHRSKSLESFSFRYTASTLSTVLFPSLSSIQDDAYKLSSAVIKIFHLLSFFSFLACGLLFVSGRELIIILFSSKWEPSVNFFLILISGAFAGQGISFFNSVLLSSDQAAKYLKLNLTTKLLLMINFIILFLGNLTFYLVGYILIQFLMYLVYLVVVSRYFGFGLILIILLAKQIIIYLLAIGGTLLLMSILQATNPYLVFLLSLLLYFILFLLLTRIVNKESLLVTRNEMKSLISKLSWH